MASLLVKETARANAAAFKAAVAKKPVSRTLQKRIEANRQAWRESFNDRLRFAERLLKG